ncbi:programmed cell death protein 2 isoform X2 [Electrophorus electricus]|uniref:programmed cell death protein 2 isoform X2 n=1 Tax=Electrophorus electricus TaxID=8005 RepID=UPI000F0A1915|nr:programmed cell death protein 2 isoform X2 [Electrophorus electricus]
MAGNIPKSERETGVILGFLEEAEAWQLLSAQFPSKVGGKPAWLSQQNLPTLPEIECEKCQTPLVFLLQVYAPLVGYERSFHRTLYVFCCKTPACYTRNDSRCFKVYRSQLRRENEFYSFNPPPDEKPADPGDEHRILSTGVKLCYLCGCPGQKACSRCHLVTYCSKEHQVIDWKQRHKKECCDEASVASEILNSFVFPERELVTEPEKLPVKHEELCASNSSEQVNYTSDLEEKELESMAFHETRDSKVFLKFKKCIATEPHQVLRYCREGSPLWLSSEHVPIKAEVPKCPCGAERTFEFQIMPQLLNHLKVDRKDASIDWGTLVIYTCTDSCDQGNKYSPEFIWKQDFSEDRVL